MSLVYVLETGISLMKYLALFLSAKKWQIQDEIIIYIP